MKNYVGRRVQIIAKGVIGAGYFKTGQYAYIIGATEDGGVYCVDREVADLSKRGQLCFLIAKTKEARGGALWISAKAVRLTKRRGVAACKK
jgi:hypothetical protein